MGIAEDYANVRLAGKAEPASTPPTHSDRLVGKLHSAEFASQFLAQVSRVKNSTTPHAPPGAANWQLPPPSKRMAWQGLSTGELCRTLKDPTKNGDMSLAQLYRHLDEHPLVLWAWHPGPGRTLPPLTHQEFMAKVKEWIDDLAD